LVAWDSHDIVPFFGQESITALISLVAFVSLMMLTIDLRDQLQSDAAEVDSIRRDRVFTTKLLASATTIADHLPDSSCELVSAGSLIACKRNRLKVAPRSSVHAAPAILDRG